MPAGHAQRPPPVDTLASPPSSKTTHIRNKDGTKLITVPSRKVPDPDSAPAVPPSDYPPVMDYPIPASSGTATGKKNRKKKRGGRASRTLYDDVDDGNHALEGHYGHAPANGPVPPSHDARRYQQDIAETLAEYDVVEDDDEEPELEDVEDEDDEYYSEQEHYDDGISYNHPAASNSAPAPAGGKRKNKKKKKKGGVNGQDNAIAPANPASQRSNKNKDRIWNTSTQEERERIKDFWLSLGESERRSLVKVEKDAVLRKMKEQQKHSCSCSVCGRKRTAIEEELEVLYDAYYEELEQYANQQQGSKPVYGGPAAFLHRHHRSPSPDDSHHIDDGSEEYDEEYDDEVLDEEDEDERQHDDPRPDFFNFGNSLTVQGGILTVADDLLKNDGKKFIEMMEQLAERRMQREEEANAAANGHTPMPLHQQQAHAAHNHVQQEYDEEEDYEDDEEDEDEYDEEEEEDEPDNMTEEQRMEEGRRMFQIFAARMFEQRVLTAYREKVAKERQMKLLEEIEEDNRRAEEREQRKAKEKDKKKERKRLQRQAKEEERLRKEAERANEEARLKEAEQKKAEEQKKRKEEQRLKREAERKAAEEERLRKEEEKRRRLQEEREREAERERKRKEHQERERKKREEEKRKKQEEKEAREREARDKKEREDQQRRDRETKAKEAALEKERKRKEDEVRAKAEAAAAAAKRNAAPAPTNIQPPTAPANFHSPHLSVVTPAIPKQAVGASPGRARNASQQGSMVGSVGSSPKTPQVAPPSASPSTPILQQNVPGPILTQNKVFQFPPNTMPPVSPMHGIAPPPGVTPPEHYGNLSPMAANGMVQPFLVGMPPGRAMGNGVPMFAPPQQLPHPQFRGYSGPNGMPMQVPVAPGMRNVPQQGRGFYEMPQHQFPPPGMPLPPPSSPFIGRAEHIPGTHSRTPSGSFEPFPHRPNPIQRPASVAPPKPADEQQNVDELSKVMGSRALLEDDDDASLEENLSPSRRASNIPFAPRPTRNIPVSSPLFSDTVGGGAEVFGHHSWSNPAPLGALSNSLPNTWGNGAAFEAIKPMGNGYTNRPGWSDTDAARSTFNRRRISRLDNVRSLVCMQFRDLAGPANQQVELSTLQRSVERNATAELGSIAQKEINEALEVEGDLQNGGGNFKMTHDKNGRTLVQYEPDDTISEHLSGGGPHGPSSVGEIGSPSLGAAPLFRIPFVSTVAPVPPPGMAASPAGF